MEKQSNTPNNFGRQQRLRSSIDYRVRMDGIVAEAYALSMHISGRTVPEPTLMKALLEGVAFAIEVGANHHCMLTTLVGTEQPAIGELLKHDVRFATQLDPVVRQDKIAVLYKRIELGYIEPSCARWLRSLLMRGAGIFLRSLPGLSGRGECRVSLVIARAGLAALRAERALREMAASGDGQGAMQSGDGQVVNQPEGGDGQADRLPEVAPAAGPPVVGPYLAVSKHDVRLWRGADGKAHLSIPHVVHHSPTGPEWGYAGSGPKDCALSILAAFTDVTRAERLAHDFTRDVISRIPWGGGVLPAKAISAWILAQPR